MCTLTQLPRGVVLRIRFARVREFIAEICGKKTDETQAVRQSDRLETILNPPNSKIITQSVLTSITVYTPTSSFTCPTSENSGLDNLD